MKSQQYEAQGFCTSCPDAKDVTDILEQFGFGLVLQMKAIQPAKSSTVAPLPAQYHYSHHQDGCEVIYLAGKDKPEPGQIFPKHASRFWVHSGANPLFYQWVVQRLSASWPLTWQNFQHPNSTREKTTGKKLRSA